MASVPQICNWALARIGITRFITALDDASLEARCCDLFYEQMRDAVLADVDWNFARRRATLTAGTETVTNWAYTFPLPSDFLAARYVVIPNTRNPIATQRVPYALELNEAGTAMLLHCDQVDPELVYTARITAPGLFSAQFANAVAWGMAAELSQSLVKKPEMYKPLQEQFLMSKARADATMKQSEQEDAPADSEFIQFRGG